MSEISVVVTGGGTGGHVYPALAVVEALAREATPGTVVPHFIGTSGGMEEQIVRHAGIPFAGIAAGALRGRAPVETARNLGKMASGFAQARRLLRERRATAVLATGGYVCVPVVWAARSLGLPVLIYLPDVTPGWAVRSLAPLATRVAVTNQRAARWFARERVVVTGYPVRHDLLTATREEARRRLELPDDGLPVLLVYGGSRGARSLNLAIARSLGRLTEVARVIHVTGDATADETAAAAARTEHRSDRYRSFRYLHDDFPFALVAASLVICRSGASVLGELPAAGLPSILVPYPYAGAHQEPNARALEEEGAATVVLDRAVETDLVDTAVALLNNPAKLSLMSEAARRLARPDAAEAIAREVLDLARRRFQTAA